MKLRSLTLPAVLVVSAVATAVFGPTKSYSVDGSHSSIDFAAPILDGLSEVTGKFASFKSSVILDETDITKSSVTATVKADSVLTGIDARDAHLKKKEFFDVAEFPDMTFASSKVEKNGEHLSAKGTLTFRGVSKDVTIPFTLAKKDVKGTQVACINGRFSFNRRDFGVNYSDGVVGDMIELRFSLLAVQR